MRRSSGLTREISSRSALAGNVLLVNLVAAAAVAVTIPFTFPGADMPVAILLAMVPSLVLGTVYVIFNVAMPRSGGDYLYISRTLHPSIGFAANFSFVLWNIIFGGFLANQVSTVYLSAFFTAVKLPGAASAVSSHKWVAFAIGTVVIIAMAAIVIVGTRFAMRLMNWCFYIGMAALLATLGLIAATSHSAFRHAVNAQGSYDKILASAHKAGYASPHSWHEFTPTINAVALVSLTTLFVMYSAYAGGEVRNVRRSVPIAIYGSALIGGLVFLIMGIVAVHSWSNDFIAASNYLAVNSPKQYPLSSSPSFAFFAVLPRIRASCGRSSPTAGLHPADRRQPHLRLHRTIAMPVRMVLRPAVPTGRRLREPANPHAAGRDRHPGGRQHDRAHLVHVPGHRDLPRRVDHGLHLDLPHHRACGCLVPVRAPRALPGIPVTEELPRRARHHHRRTAHDRDAGRDGLRVPHQLDLRRERNSEPRVLPRLLGDRPRRLPRRPLCAQPTGVDLNSAFIELPPE